jgi:hypothetical protein
MIQALRKRFLAGWTPDSYAELRRRLDERTRTRLPFRVAETPCFFAKPFVDELAAAGADLIRQLQSPAYRAIADGAVPAAFRVPGDAARPLFVQVDFGLVRTPGGGLAPRLVEIQGFPSLYAFQQLLAETYAELYDLPHQPFPHFRDLLGRAILGAHAPENVVLLEIDPANQKTLADFHVTEDWFGVRAVCVTRVRQRGTRLFYDRDGVETPIHRIYNRAIADEQVRRGIEPAFRWTDDLDVEWAGHPNDYFRISKFSLPYLQHETVPETQFLTEPPDDLEDWVLKPLFSFAGHGVRIGPSRADIEAIPAHDRQNWILQRRCRFEPVIATPAGPTQPEIRVMYIWLDELHAVATLVRLGRGAMMGVDHNKGLDWVGASAGLWIPS